MRDWVIRALTDRLFELKGRDDLGDYYGLTVQVPREVWQKIGNYFFKMTPDKVEGSWISAEALYGLPPFFGRTRPYGWMTVKVKTVEQIVKEYAKEVADEEELRKVEEILQERERKRQEEEERKRQIQEKKRILKEIKEYIKQQGEKPDGLFKLEGERIDDPFCRPDEFIYGGGEWFVIEKDYIWYVIGNSADGDDWSWNNTERGIGFRVPFSEELAQKIRTLRGGSK